MAGAFVPLAEWYAPAETYRHRGQDIVYRRAGAGEALLVLHGFPSASWDFHKIWDALTARFEVIAPDMIGFGYSAKPKPYAYSLFDQADLMEGLLHSLGVDRLHILAHDYGDTVVQEMLARARERSSYFDIASVALTNGGMFYDAIRQAPMQKALRAPLGRLLQHVMRPGRFKPAFAAIFGPETRPSPAELDAFWQLIVKNRGKRIMHPLIQYLGEREAYQERWSQALARAPAPLRLIYGPEDPISGETIAARYREVVANPDTVALDGIGHYPQIEAPEALIDAFDAFHARWAGCR